MQPVIIDIYRVNKWSSKLLDYLAKNDRVLKEWGTGTGNYEYRSRLAKEFDSIVYGFKEVIDPYYLHGYHCTRLTEHEVAKINEEGMSLQNLNTLKERIELLKNSGLLHVQVGELLIADNQADDSNRKEMLWFCFFPPYKASQRGIERFFRSWGGEALYNSHESNSFTGNALAEIGTPCVIEAYIAVSGFQSYSFELNLIHRYMAHKGWHDKMGLYENFTRTAIPPKDIISVIQYPNKRFFQLTRCKEWNHPL
jgi:hypothetical protein